MELRPKLYALLLIRSLHRANNGAWHEWHSPEQADEEDLAYAIERGWIELSPTKDAMRLTDAGCYAVEYLWGASGSEPLPQ